MKKMELGRTGVEVSALCFGAMRCGTRNSWEESVALLDMFVEAGGDFIDTANCYSWWYEGGAGGESEDVLGRWMKERGNRDRLLIATKVGIEYQDVARGLPAKTIEQECDRSLKRMGIETIDLYYAHKDDRNTPLEETMAAFDRLIRAGKVRFIGASNYPAWRLADAEAICQANGLTPYSCVQQRYTYLRPKPGARFDPQLSTDQNLLDFCADKGLTLLPYTPLLEGSYARADKPIPAQYVGPDADARLHALCEAAAQTGATVHQVILAWMMQHEPPLLPVFSASTPEQMREDLGALDVALTPEQMSHLNEASA